MATSLLRMLGRSRRGVVGGTALAAIVLPAAGVGHGGDLEPPRREADVAAVHAAPPSVAAIDLARRARRLEARALRADTSAVVDSTAAPPRGASPFGTVTDTIAADSARRLYDSVAVLVPAVRDWLVLRAMALEPEVGRRTARAARLTLPIARARVARTDAIARARHGDAAGAALRLATIDPVAALQLRLLDTTLRAPMVRDSVRAALVALARAGGPEAGRAALVADAAFPALGVAERTTLARAMASAAPARALAALDAAVALAAATPDDAVLRATLAARVGGARVAARAWEDAARLAGEGPVATAARVQQGRQLVRAGADSEATALLAAVVAANGADTASAFAGWLLGDRAASADRTDEARAHFAAIARRHPASSWASRGAFEAALLLVGTADSLAAAEFDVVASRWPTSDEAPAALYWAGRTRAALGDTAAATVRWERVVAGFPLSHHAELAAGRLGRPVPPPLEGAVVQPLAAARAGADRMETLEALGLMPEAALERGALVAGAGEDPRRLLATAAVLVETTRPGLGIALADRAVATGAPLDAATLRLLYPFPHRALIRSEAARRGVDPALAAALIRQESRFTPDAVSGVGARGLMQLMPEVARALARSEGRRFTPAMLDDPAVNVPLGMRHLASDLARWPHPAYALASYNAGGSRVARWRTRRGGDDPELFTERIPFAETRDYVRTVLRTRALYARLWRDDATPGARGR